MTLPVIIQLQG